VSIIGGHLASPWLRRALLAALLVVLSLASGFTAAGLNDWYQGRDFHCFWITGHIVVSGGDPYDAAQYVPAILTVASSEAKALAHCGYRLAYPPWTGLAFAPFGALSLPAAATLWASLIVMATVIGIYWTWQLVGKRRIPWPVIAVLVVCTAPGIHTFIEGQLGAFTFALTAGAALSMRRERDTAGGIATALLSVKPQTGAGFGAVVLGLAILRRRRRFIIAAGVAGLVLAGVSQLLRPGWIVEFVGGATELSGSIADRATIWNLAGSWPLAVVMIALLFTAVVVLIRGRGADDADILGLAVSFSLVVAPYAWNHDYVVLAIPWSMTIAHAGQLRPWLRRTLTYATVMVAAPLLWAIGATIEAFLRGETFYAVVPILTALLLAFAIRLAPRPLLSVVAT
jgi:MYXO-CTERM domain-containing protein